MRPKLAVLRALLLGVLACLMAPGGHCLAGGTRPLEVPAAGLRASPPDLIECSGTLTLEPCYSVVLHQGEHLVGLSVREGATVTAGQPLVRLENDSLIKELSALEERRLSALQARDRIDLLTLKAQLCRSQVQRLSERMEKERAISRKVPSYQSEFKVDDLTESRQSKLDELSLVQAELAQARAAGASQAALAELLERQAAAVKQKIAGLTVHAPFSGTVTRVHAGDRRPAAGDLVVEVCKIGGLVVKARAYQHQIPYLHAGMVARVYPASSKDQVLSGTVRSIEPVTQEATGERFPVFPVVIVLDRVPPGLLAGMSVGFEFLTSEKGTSRAP